MTTIVADVTRGLLVSDSLVSDGVIKWQSPKIERIGDALVGCAGGCAEIEAFLRWRRGGCSGRRPRVTSDFAALELDDVGLWMWDKAMEKYPPGRSFHAVGSGAKAAIAAIILGCDPVRAVEVACEVDDGSAPPVQILRLHEK